MSAGRRAFHAAMAAFTAAALSACAPQDRQAPTGGAGAGGHAGIGGGSGGNSGDTPGGSGGYGGSGDSGVSPGPHPLAISGQEAVTRVAKLLWKATPDGDLTRRADAIKTREDVNQLALEMLKDPRARVGVGAFYRWWLWLDLTASGQTTKVFDDFGPLFKPANYPEWTAQLKIDAANETETFAVNVTLDLDGAFKTLMTAPFSYINEGLAGVYGVSGITGNDLRKVDLDPKQRGGLLTQISLLSLDTALNVTDPPRRGRIVRDRFYCFRVPPLTPLPAGPTAPPGSGNRTFFETKTSGLPCLACHYNQQLNQVGFAFESFNQIGRYRTMDDRGQPVDVTGLHLKDRSAGDLPFDGPLQLAALLVDQDQVHQCMAQQWLAFATGGDYQDYRNADIDVIRAAFKSSGLNLRALIAATVSSETFLLPAGQKPNPGTVTVNPDFQVASSVCPNAGASGANGGANPTAGPLPEGCAEAPAIFSDIKHSCTYCHTPGIALYWDGGFDMTTPGWEKKLVDAGPPDCAPFTNMCKGKGLKYLNRTQPATGLFLDKLKPNPPCGSPMPHLLAPLSDSELACIQKWANNIAAGGPGK